MEKQIEILSEILSLVRFYDKRINSLSYDVLESERLGIYFYNKICEKNLKHARRASARLRDRYDRYLKDMYTFSSGYDCVK